MRFRKTRFRRRKRPGMLMLPLSLCDEQETWETQNDVCLEGGRVVAVQLHPGLQGRESKAVAFIDANRPQALISQTLRHSLTVKGIRFHWSLGVNEVIDSGGNEVIHEVRLAVVKLETDAVGSPVMLPNLWTEYGPEIGDVLWRGFGIIYQPHTDDYANNPPGTEYPGYAGSALGFRGMVGNFQGFGGGEAPPVQIKTARRLKEEDAIFLCYSVKNNIPPTSEGTLTIHTSLNLFGVAAVRSNAQ